jgi:hypothetical protein
MNSTTLYWEAHKLLESQLMEDGFYDPGGSKVNSALPSLAALRRKPADAAREVILLDGRKDEDLVPRSYHARINVS